MTIKKMFYMMGLISIFLISYVMAENPGATHDEKIELSMDKANKYALSQNYNVRIAKLKVSEQEMVTGQVKSGYLPQVNVSLSQSRQRVNYTSSGFGISGNNSSVYTYSSFVGNISVTQSIFNQSLIKTIQKSLESEKMMKADYLSTQEAITLNTISLYLEALRYKARLSAAQARLEAAKALLEQTEKFERVGTGSKLETARAELQYQNEWQTLSESSVSYENSKIELAQFIGISQNTIIALMDDMVREPSNSISVDSAFLIALENRSDMRSAKSKEKILQLAIAKAKADRMPTLGIEGDMGRSGKDPSDTENTFFIGAVVSVPLFTGNNISYTVKQAENQLEQQKVSIKQLASEIERDIRESLLLVIAGGEQVKASQKGVLAAETALKLTRSKYNAGVITNVEVLDAQDTLARAQENQIRALYNFNIAKANLAKAMGQLGMYYSSN